MKIAELVQHSEDILAGKASIQPGQPTEFTPAMDYNDGIAQGDLNLILVEKVPKGYVKQSPKQKKLVPGQTEGARHFLMRLTGVEIFVHPDWNLDDYDGQNGPVLVVTKTVTIEHPTHGNVTIHPTRTVECRYQREWDAEQKRERRNAD